MPHDPIVHTVATALAEAGAFPPVSALAYARRAIDEFSLTGPVPVRRSTDTLTVSSADAHIAALEHAVIEAALNWHHAHRGDFDTMLTATQTLHRNTSALAAALKETD